MIENFKFLIFSQQLASSIKFSPPGFSSYTFPFTFHLSFLVSHLLLKIDSYNQAENNSYYYK
jgi:hypothetical protein